MRRTPDICRERRTRVTLHCMIPRETFAMSFFLETINIIIFVEQIKQQQEQKDNERFTYSIIRECNKSFSITNTYVSLWVPHVLHLRELVFFSSRRSKRLNDLSKVLPSHQILCQIIISVYIHWNAFYVLCCSIWLCNFKPIF